MLSSFFCLGFVLFASLIPDAQGKVFLSHCLKIFSLLYCFYHDFFACMVLFERWASNIFSAVVYRVNNVNTSSQEPLHLAFGVALTNFLTVD